MIAIVDYGAGNLRSVTNAFRAIGEDPLVTTEPAVLRDADGIVLPGVGAFGDGIDNLRARGFEDVLNDEVIGKRKPFFGICLGLQFMAEQSLERGSHRGLGWIPGTVVPIVPSDPKFKVPHMGWNDLEIERASDLFVDLEDRPVVYFVHSYHLDVAECADEVVTARCWHGCRLVASVQRDHMFGVQFHPEKSQQAGIQILKNFVRFVRDAEKAPYTCSHPA